MNFQSPPQSIIIELQPIDLLERRMRHVVELVDLAETLGFAINGFTDENDLIRRIGTVEIELLSNLITMKDRNYPMEKIFSSELRLEKFNAIAIRITDALHINF